MAEDIGNRIDVNPSIGDAICDAIEERHGREAQIILIVFPSDGDNPQPTFVSSFPPVVMESVLKQLGAQIGDVADSRVVTTNDGSDGTGLETN